MINDIKLSDHKLIQIRNKKKKIPKTSFAWTVFLFWFIKKVTEIANHPENIKY